MPYKDPEKRLAASRRAGAKRRAERPELVAKWRRENYLRKREDRLSYAAAYKAANRSRYTDNEQRRRARKLNQFVEDVDRSVVYKMHGGMCGICEQFVPEDDFHVDHVIPLSKGGMHGYINVQPAHPMCNMRKGDRV